MQEKKSWELEPEEKTRIQRETAEIAKKYREQENQQSQVPSQTLQQDDFQPMQQGQIQQPMPQQPMPQQAMPDIGGMEL